ncbi:MAG: hypothetical protein VYB44_07390 [Bacteroidota bacterium]|nr:hypothetical protein [Bacteroidota bacterium]
MAGALGTRKRVERLLKAKPHLRDSDDKLIANIWYNDAGICENNNMTAVEFLNLVADGRLTNPETIRRSRQQLQEQNPGLRGESYVERKTKKQEKARVDLGYKK